MKLIGVVSEEVRPDQAGDLWIGPPSDGLVTVQRLDQPEKKRDLYRRGLMPLGCLEDVAAAIREVDVPEECGAVSLKPDELRGHHDES